MTLADDVLAALSASVDRSKLEAALGKLRPSPAGAGATTVSKEKASGSEARVLERILLTDMLDDAILHARPGDAAYPVRLFLGELGQKLSDDDAFSLASGLNLYFRVDMEEEIKMSLGLLLSRLYYRLELEDPSLREQLSPVLAELLSAQLSLVHFEAIDGQRTFDSSRHERTADSDGSQARIREARSFLCRVESNQAVRVKAKVRT